MSDQPSPTRTLKLATQIVSAHVRGNRLPADALPNLIESVFKTLANIELPAPEAEAPVPAVPVKKSIFPDYIVCLEDGKKMTMLKRHLKTAYGMSPEQYRAKWGLPASYPMVAPNYALKRSTLAKSIGLGRKPGARMAAPKAVEPVEAPEPTPAPVAMEPSAETIFSNFPKGGSETVPAKVEAVAAPISKPEKAAASKGGTAVKKVTGKTAGKSKGR